MGAYELTPLSIRHYGTHQSLQVIASFDVGADAMARQRTIDYLASMHKMDLKTTKSLMYDPKLASVLAQNVKGHIHVSPSAFEQDASWLAAVILHEVVHSDQLQFYADQGFAFSPQTPQPELERMLFNLDEYEGFYWAWRNSAALSLSKKQSKELDREVELWRVDIGDEDDKDIKKIIDDRKFNDARLAIIKKRRAQKP
jgi:hypothetical protein